MTRISLTFMGFLATLLAIVMAGAVPGMSQEEVVLTIADQGQMRTFTLSDLEDIGSDTIVTTTIWTEGPQEFTGVSLHHLVSALGVAGHDLRATAINDYVVDIPASDAVEGGALVAFSRNGQPMSVRDNGPLWIVYPYDSDPAFQTESIYSRSIWQLVRIDVLD